MKQFFHQTTATLDPPCYNQSDSEVKLTVSGGRKANRKII